MAGKRAAFFSLLSWFWRRLCRARHRVRSSVRHGRLVETNSNEADQVAPEKIFQTATGFMGARFLFAANEIGLFEALAGGPLGLEEIAQRTDLTRANSKLRKEFVDDRWAR